MIRILASLAWATAMYPFRRMTAPLRMMPHFIIVGAQRCGTTSLYTALCRHPAVRPAFRKEIHYFDLSFNRGPGWYRSHFCLRSAGAAKGSVITGEASPYYMFHPLAIGRMATELPAAKVIVLLRNPVDRAFSHYHHNIHRRRETLSFEDAIAQEETRLAGEESHMLTNEYYNSLAHQNHSYLARGIYATQVETLLRLYPAGQTLVLKSEEFFERGSVMLKAVHTFLGLPDAPEAGALPFLNEGKYAPMKAETRARLTTFFAPHNSRLEALLSWNATW